ncbi:MAG TPA: extracellular solute-binding protein, partial [Xanthobacteraceae bacterium]|nr:extracellular solute-binding protein [Xanthobacteraceae bacterium]
MAGIDRRRFLQSSGGGLAGILASGRAPAFAQTTTLHWLRLGDFVPASDTLLRRELLPEAEKALGLKITLETINGNDLQARIASSIQSGSGADLIHAMHNWPQLYAESLADVSDVAEEIAKEQGGFYDIFPAIAKGEKGWLGVPWAALGILLCYRKSWFDEIGLSKFPDTWEGYRAAGKLLKAKGRPIGQTLGHAYNDAPAFTYPYLWAFGGKELEADGKTVALNSKETLESVKFIAGFWKDAHDEGGLAWDDSNNNRAFL